VAASLVAGVIGFGLLALRNRHYRELKTAEAGPGRRGSADDEPANDCKANLDKTAGGGQHGRP
jgi:hypothetical protein